MKRCEACPAAGARKVNCICTPAPVLCPGCTDVHRCPRLAMAQSTKKKTEGSEIVRPLLEALHDLGVYAIRTQSGRLRVRNGFMHLAPEGTPDIQGFFADGRGFVVETKMSHSDTCGCSSCKAQRDIRKELERRNVAYVFARSVEAALVGLGLVKT